MGSINLLSPLSSIHGIGPRFVQKLSKLHIETIKDLLWHFPTRYEDFSNVTKISDLIPREECTIQALVKKINVRRSWHKRMFIIEAKLEDETGEIRAVWFNQTYIKNILEPGKTANFSGKVSESHEGELYFSNPGYEVMTFQDKETKHTGRIVPIYPETKGLTSKGIRYLIQPLLKAIEKPKESFPQKIVKQHSLLSLSEALNIIHFPKTLDDAMEARRRFNFEELFLLQLHLLGERARLTKEKAPALDISVEMIKAFLETLPFELTPSQKQTLWEIIKDLNKPTPMNRLLQGDVGSGKTIIAALAAICTAHKGYQATLMAPTEILARQHYQTIIKFFPDHEEGVALLTGNESKLSYGHGLETDLKKPSLIKEVENGKVNIVIGTHTLIATSKTKKERKITFPSLGLVIVDEQHRFGVRQRAELTKRKEYIPHFLSMSATPIPRTLSLTFFSDLDLSLITELPKNRKVIITSAVPPEERTKAYAFIRSEIKKGRQAFVVCPRIENPNLKSKISNNFEFQNKKELIEIEIKSVKEEYEKLSKKIFPDLRVAMLHGKMPARGGSALGGKANKAEIMKNFADGKIDILISTSVIEVGVDIPNASIMMIEGSERFGLAQLYQFKGRVGRGEHQSYCFLFTDSSSEEVKKRLTSIVEAKNGLELAEKDLKFRGPGEFLGEGQTGMPDLAMRALQHPQLMKDARKSAEEIIKRDPELSLYPDLKNSVKIFASQIHRE